MGIVNADYRLAEGGRGPLSTGIGHSALEEIAGRQNPEPEPSVSNWTHARAQADGSPTSAQRLGNTPALPNPIPFSA